MIAKAYRHLLKPILFRFDPEEIHHLFVNVGESLGKTTAGRNLIASLYDYDGPDISRTVDGITYRTPVLLAAGFDYNARLTQILGSMAFGGVEVGSITAFPCPGNEPPRMARAPKSESLIVYKGLRNEGVDRIIERLQSRPTQEGLVLGVSIAMTNAESSATRQGAIDDYRTSLQKLTDAGIGDYYTINISCPNVAGGESFTNPEALRELLAALDEVRVESPRYTKMPISIDQETYLELLDLVREFDFDGVIVGNLQKDYDTLEVREEAPDAYRGGLSGKPCREASTQRIALTRDHCGDDFTIIGCGGILSADDALEKLDAGADLLQLISGMIFEGPHLIGDIAQAIADRQSR